MSNFSGEDNYGKPKTDYLLKIKSMFIYDLKRETKDKIWLSAYAANNARSDYHWQVIACREELLVRTGDDEAYAECHRKASDN